jgi:hypothetical protein
MKKLLLYFLVVLAWLVTVSSCNSTLFRKMFELKIIKDDYRYGDLYRFSNLKQFKQSTVICDKEFEKLPISEKQNVELYVVGDSFLNKDRFFDENDFPFKKYTYINWSEKKRNIVLDRSMRNVLIFESLERHVRERLVDMQSNIVFDNKTPQLIENHTIWQQIKPKIFNIYIEQCLDQMFFGTDWAFKMKEIKANINQKYFKRLNASVSLSNDQQNIFYNSDKDSTSNFSAFKSLPNIELDSIVAKINASSAYYKNKGFDLVLVSIIPNKATILAQHDGQYNQMINRIVSNNALKVPFINVYPDFIKNKNEVYSKSDTHWNCTGKEIWQKKTLEIIYENLKVNDKLKQGVL